MTSSQQCQWASADGVRNCTLFAENDQYCRWHNPTEGKGGPDDIALLESYAKDGQKMTGFSLRRAQLTGIDLTHRAGSTTDLRYADFYRAELGNAHFFDADLRHASFLKANLQGANLNQAHMEGADLLGANFSGAKLEGVHWGSHIRQELAASKTDDPEAKLGQLAEAEEVYRMLRRESENRGLFHDAGRFFQKEMRMRRYQKPRISFDRGISKLVDLLCGYGESPHRVILFSMVLIFGCAIGYLFLGLRAGDAVVVLGNGQSIPEQFLTCLYFSVVTFTTLGYGDVVPIGTARLLASLQAFVGAFTIALFVVVFMKKMTR